MQVKYGMQAEPGLFPKQVCLMKISCYCSQPGWLLFFDIAPSMFVYLSRGNIVTVSNSLFPALFSEEAVLSPAVCGTVAED